MKGWELQAQAGRYDLHRKGKDRRPTEHLVSDAETFSLPQHRQKHTIPQVVWPYFIWQKRHTSTRSQSNTKMHMGSSKQIYNMNQSEIPDISGIFDSKKEHKSGKKIYGDPTLRFSLPA